MAELYKAKLGSTLKVFLLSFISWNNSLRLVNSFNDNQHVYKGKIYKIPDAEADFFTAKAYCEEDGGTLAKISSKTIADDFYAPFSQFLRRNIWEVCARIGASYMADRGHWIWTDGTVAKNVQWTQQREYYAMRDLLACGRLCQGDEEWKWEPADCIRPAKFVCEYEDPDPERCEPACVTTPEHSKLSDEVVIRKAEAGLIVGDPVFTISVPMATMCSRVCTMEENCGMFNFNMATRECRGYVRSSTVDYKENPKWEVWVITRT